MPLQVPYTINRGNSQYFPYLSETWASDQTAIDPNMWTQAVTGGSTIARDMTDTDFPKVRLTAVASNTARLRTEYRFRATPGLITSSTMMRELFVEFELKFTTVANIDNAASFIGLTSSTTATRATTNLIGFALSSDALQTVTDSSGVETTNAPASITLTNRNLYQIRIMANQVEFLINGSTSQTHTTNVPNLLPYLMFYLPAEAGGSAILDVGFVNAYYRGVDNLR